MSFIDIIIVAVIGYNIFKSMRRGFIKIAADLMGISGGLWFAWCYVTQSSEQLALMLKIPLKYAYPLAFLLLWAVFFLAISFAGNILSKFFKASFLGFFDFLGGLFLGALKGVMITFLFILPMLYFDFMPLNKSVLVTPLKPYLLKIIKKTVGPELPLQNDFNDLKNKVLDNSKEFLNKEKVDNSQKKRGDS
ncbi:CvpA family protein [bacterium]|jgi:uncharacterized membrane protein required for colicin V production|nr:CvpA family protein [bacterium]MBT3581582.1 CvpA family protein [bacterium]MBT4552744.1 CvpA family protein [bacterium]MBT5988956.1 CvpA family protein [bacterium]MBT7088668.1 CvpA family protein [bacterium]